MTPMGGYVQSHELRGRCRSRAENFPWWDSNTQSSDLHSEKCHGCRSQDFSACTQTRVGIAGLEECPTKKARCNTDAGSSSWCSSGFFNLQGVSLRRRLSHNVCTAPVRLHASASMHMLKPLPLAAMPLFPHIKILHPLTGVGSAALAAALPYPGMAI